MKSFFTTLVCLLGLSGIVSGQQINPVVDLEQSKVQITDFQLISSPAAIFQDEIQLNNPVVTQESLRSPGGSGPLTPLAIPANDNCANAIPLTINAPCVNGTNKESTIQAGESTACQGAITKSVWYSFVATAATLYVEVERTASSGCYLSSAVYSGACLPSTALACEDAAFGPNLNIHNLTGLTVGATYYVQVSYTAGGPCGNNANANTGADFCIKVGRPVVCGTCNNPCGPVCIFASPPTVAQVTSTCTRYDLQSRLNAGQVRTQCYTFTAVATSFSLQMIINSVGCSGGNVTTFDWQLYPSNCSGVVQSGNLSNLNASGLTIGAGYVLCYTWTAACQHNSVYPYIVATAPLPVELLHFGGKPVEKTIRLDWITASETNNSYFSIQRSDDGTSFIELGTLKGAGNSTNMNEYSFIDSRPLEGTNYYRLVQFDFDNSSSYSDVIALKYNEKYSVTLDKNPVTDILNLTLNSDEDMDVNISIMNQYGKMVVAQAGNLTGGYNNYTISTSSLSSGVYHLRIEAGGKTSWLKFLKM